MKQYAGFNSARSYWNYALTAVAVAALVCCIFGIPAEKLFATYFVGLLALLTVSGSLFFSVIASLARKPE